MSSFSSSFENCWRRLIFVGVQLTVSFNLISTWLGSVALRCNFLLRTCCVYWFHGMLVTPMAACTQWPRSAWPFSVRTAWRELTHVGSHKAVFLCTWYERVINVFSTCCNLLDNIHHLIKGVVFNSHPALGGFSKNTELLHTVFKRIWRAWR